MTKAKFGDVVHLFNGGLTHPQCAIYLGDNNWIEFCHNTAGHLNRRNFAYDEHDIKGNIAEALRQFLLELND